MRIGIDISQSAYEATGVGNLVFQLINSMIKQDHKNEYILFFSSLRRQLPESFNNLKKVNKKVQIKKFKYPPVFLDLLWNKLHIIPIEWFIGELDVFITSDWTQPPVKKAKNVTILYDLIVYKYPQETAKKIIETQKRRLEWVKKECDKVICISESTKNDAIKILSINEEKLAVIYPGI